jgi:hypothetical protein
MTTRIADALHTRVGRLFLACALALLAVAAIAWRTIAPAEAGPGYDVPRSAALEAKLGVRFIQAAVVADGGIVELRYTVLDAQKASKFQRAVHNPPVLRSERRPGALYRTALMRQGHELRPGQNYYILYLNNRRAVRPGETLEIDAGGQTLAKVPVR